MTTPAIGTHDVTANRHPRRIQRRRNKGWRMPEGAVYVGRPTRWGNPYVTMSAGRVWPARIKLNRAAPAVESGLDVVECFRVWARAQMAADSGWLTPLRGKDLACWCPLDQPCHADVLLELANR